MDLAARRHLQSPSRSCVGVPCPPLSPFDARWCWLGFASKSLICKKECRNPCGRRLTTTTPQSDETRTRCNLSGGFLRGLPLRLPVHRDFTGARLPCGVRSRFGIYTSPKANGKCDPPPSRPFPRNVFECPVPALISNVCDRIRNGYTQHMEPNPSKPWLPACVSFA